MTAQNVAFWALAIAMGAGAIGVVRSKNIVHAALFLIIVLVGAAAQYIVLLAEFVGITQFFIYIGAIAVLFLFGIMLTRAPMRAGNFDNDQRWPAAIVAVMVRTGEKRLPSFNARTGAFPVTIITVMVSPIARPIPSITAVNTPERAAGKVTRQIVCQRVAPSAHAPSR